MNALDIQPRVQSRAVAAPRAHYVELKANVHRKLLNRLNLEALANAERGRAESEMRTLVLELLSEENAPLSLTEREALFGDLVDEVFGLGPLEPLLRDGTISDILVNTYKNVFVERNGQIERVATSFQDDKHLLRVIDRIVSGVGRRVDDSSPMVDARLADGSRVNAIIPPLAVDGPLLSIRRFPAERLKADDLVTLRALTKPMLDFLAHCVRARMNALISGGTGAGKTTLLNVLSSFIGERERVVTIEDAAELQLHQEHVARLETRPPNVEGKGAVRQRQLVINALRMRPDRIVIGEVRGEEALDMLQAMNTGHDGSLTTVHANTPRDALSRIETMIAMGATNMPERAMRQQLASAVQLVVQQTRLSDGSRKITSISEITGMEGDIITMQEIYLFEKMGITQDGKVIGRFRATGVRPKCCERLRASGIHLPADMFEGVTEVR
ncbi:MAG TPA: CpaF family protein [Vicinamibacterales bacterium]|jgi:pilus assembly protein CpaF|nr:CpaF family protein [Vicinamibacterales bacterium]